MTKDAGMDRISGLFQYPVGYENQYTDDVIKILFLVIHKHNINSAYIFQTSAVISASFDFQ